MPGGGLLALVSYGAQNVILKSLLELVKSLLKPGAEGLNRP